MVFAGPACDKILVLQIFVLQIARLVVLSEPAADEILELQFVRRFAEPASDTIFALQIARFVVLTWPTADEILELHSWSLLGVPVTEFSYSRLRGLWS